MKLSKLHSSRAEAWELVVQLRQGLKWKEEAEDKKERDKVKGGRERRKKRVQLDAVLVPWGLGALHSGPSSSSYYCLPDLGPGLCSGLVHFSIKGGGENSYDP